MMDSKIDYIAAFDQDLCSSLVGDVMQELGQERGSERTTSGKEPLRTLRQVARVVAVEAGFDPACVAAACSCSPATVRASVAAMRHRLQREEPNGTIHNRAQQRHPLAPVLDKARMRVMQWKATAFSSEELVN